MRPPAGFIAVELGFGFQEGPSIISTMQDLEKINRAQRALRAIVASARAA